MKQSMVLRAARIASACALVAGSSALGCARGPDVGAEGLPLRRVVVYRNGVGYFEREGRVDDEEVTFRVRTEKIGDFLATLAVIERGGSSVRSASFPVEVAREEDEEEDDDGGVAPASGDPRIRPAPEPPEKRKKRKKAELERVHLSLDGREHDLVVGYVAETPVWRPSYRLVIAPSDGAAGAAKGSADLQAWGIVQNLSGEDWKGVRLSLVAGAPLAFQATLERPVIPPRPVVTDQGEVIASVPTSETSLAEASAPPPPPPAPMAAPETVAEEEEAQADVGGGVRDEAAKKEVTREKASRRLAGRGGEGGLPAGAPPPMETRAPRPKPSGPSMPRNVSALAAVAMEGGTTRYDLPFPVDVPDKSATMVLLLAKRVPGEAIFLYAPDGGVPASASHPFRVARFTNDTNGLLERGPIAVFEAGAFLGQGMVEPLPPGATATVPFALERSLAVEVSRTDEEVGARLAKIEAGTIEIERDGVTLTKYTVKNGRDDAARTLVKHPRQPGTRLHEPPKGTEDNVGTFTALVPLTVGKRATATLEVDERRSLRRQVDWLSPLADDAVKAYLADPRADAVVVTQLQKAWELRGKLRAAVDEREGVRAEQAQLEQQSDELRRNLRAIEKNKTADELRKDLTDRLAKASARLDELTKRAIVLDMQINEQQVRFRDLIASIQMLKPLPTP